MAVLSKPVHPNVQLLLENYASAGSPRTRLLVLLATLLILRGRIVSGPIDVTKVPRGKRASPEELADALQQVYIQEKDGSKTLLVPYRDQYVTKVPISPISPSKLASDAPYFPIISSPSISSSQSLAKSKSTPTGLNTTFLHQLRSIIFRIAIPSWRSKETLLVVMHSFFLVLRTVLSIGVARLDGRIVRDLVSADGKGFLRGLGLWFLLAIPSTYTNSMIRHLQSKISLRIRTRLTRYIHDLYLSSAPHLRYYHIGSELEGVDQYITADVEAWADALAGLYGNLLKPTLDTLLFTSQLSRSLGLRGTILLFANYYVTAKILRAVTPAFGRLAVVEARLEGEYRAGVGRVGREGEEVAFYDGGAREKDILTRAYLRLIKHVNSIYKIRIAYEWTEDYVIKYLWSAAGYGLIAVPLLITRTKKAIGVQAGGDETGGRVDNVVAHRTETYISNRRLLLSLADAGGRLMYAYKDLLELAGLTTRLYTLLSTLHNLPSMPVSAEGDVIQLKNVDVVIPGSALILSAPLVRDLSLILREGEHLMITGSNGVGKTAVARVLAGLWDAHGPLASVSRPGPIADDISPSPSSTHASYAWTRPGVFVVPQRAYMVTGSLLDQVIYPHGYAQFKASGRSLEELREILEAVFLGYLPEREGGWGTRKEWRDVLSGGEKQRMALARVFYHRPRFAILDECTSAVSSDVEGQMYERAKAMGITLITISLRPSLMKYHKQLLTLTGDGSGRWTLSRVGGAEERMEMDREIVELEARLEEVGKWESRVEELEGLLRVRDV
ncbi:hypothetical protein SERLADRAFT_445189 [Serpula lacrymans var. lacrymans S7.9]|uniref:ABC transporter domain-containing protein n=1 Tax=Serpula lacrymans var. lacrymans (strain S7.9) TaxID=578457 RepID=F8NGH7_SERL9|nr:uncharacterized protein SERLADRAFT_445189 [Serpula lacrymans var. lacrymans S7.9]EGO29364.1 hypothetical protein SERLADRAFT_445189 [Serpula lacrymans var. lacrymans S7.9]